MAGSPESVKRQPELNTAGSLETKIKNMASCWKAGFGNYVTAIVISGQLYVETPEIEVKKTHFTYFRTSRKSLHADSFLNA